MDWSTLKEHWPWLSPFVAAGMGWLGRRKGLRPWHTLVRQYNLNKELETCQQDLADAIRSRDYLKVALREITEAAAMVKTAHDAGLLTMSSPSPSAPGSSPGTSTESPPTPADPPGTRSKSGTITRDDQ